MQQGQSQQISVPSPYTQSCHCALLVNIDNTFTPEPSLHLCSSLVNPAIHAPRLFVILPQHLIQLANRWGDLRTRRDVSDSTSWSSWKITTDWIVFPFVWLFYFIFWNQLVVDMVLLFFSCCSVFGDGVWRFYRWPESRSPHDVTGDLYRRYSKGKHRKPLQLSNLFQCCIAEMTNLHILAFALISCS